MSFLTAFFIFCVLQQELQSSQGKVDMRPDCPTGFFECKRSVKKPDLSATPFKKAARTLVQCPLDYWCKKVEGADDENDLKGIAKGGPGCPPGHWCKRSMTSLKRKENSVEACHQGYLCKRSLDEGDFGRMVRHDDAIGGCPAGYWCKRSVPSRKIYNSFKGCPPGIWCKRGIAEGDLAKMVNNGEAIQLGCPPGIWCKRGIAEGDLAKMVNNGEAIQLGCPPGIWCKRKAEA